jgi:hypothetical protein
LGSTPTRSGPRRWPGRFTNKACPPSFLSHPFATTSISNDSLRYTTRSMVRGHVDKYTSRSLPTRCGDDMSGNGVRPAWHTARRASRRRARHRPPPRVVRGLLTARRCRDRRSRSRGAERLARYGARAARGGACRDRRARPRRAQGTSGRCRRGVRRGDREVHRGAARARRESQHQQAGSGPTSAAANAAGERRAVCGSASATTAS